MRHPQPYSVLAARKALHELRLDDHFRRRNNQRDGHFILPKEYKVIIQALSALDSEVKERENDSIGKGTIQSNSYQDLVDDIRFIMKITGLDNQKLNQQYRIGIRSVNSFFRNQFVSTQGVYRIISACRDHCDVVLKTDIDDGLWFETDSRNFVRDTVSDLCKQMSIIIDILVTDNRVGDQGYVLNRIERAQLISAMKSLIAQLEQPVAQKSTLRKLLDWFSSIVKKSAEKEISEQLGDAIETGKEICEDLINTIESNSDSIELGGII